ncbi:MAG: type II secretion system protein, partial [Alphaproteobacteria bacterium]|nr:type II secretion system protein [Alphaproteobacteria bacterium]
MRSNESGRTLVEMLAVLAIIAILSVGGFMGYSYLVQMRKRNYSVEQIQQVMVGLETSDALKHYELGKNVGLSEVVKGPKLVEPQIIKLPLDENNFMAITVLKQGQFAVDLQITPDLCEPV